MRVEVKEKERETGPQMLSVVIRIELHTVDEFLCFLDFRLALCFEHHEFELFGEKKKGRDRNREV